MLIPRLFFRIGVAIAFSPRREAILAEAIRFKELFGADLAVIIIGEKQEHKSNQIETLFIQHNQNPEDILLIWEEPKGNTAQQIVEICHAYQIDLLLAGALRNEQRLRYSMGKVARSILLKATCSVMVMLEPQKNPKPIKRIVAMEQKAMIASRPFSHIVESLSIIPELERIDYVVEIAKRSNLLLNLIGFIDARLIKKNTSKWIKLALERRRLHLKDLPQHIKLVMHGASSMPEFKTRIIAERNKAELIVMRAPLKKSSSINRLIFQDSFRSLIQDIPCNLLILRNK